jgi:uncharacterized protein YecE (DUF72 family)
MARLLIGTSGYSYGDWVGPVYPVGTAPKDFLKVYSGEFPFSELNFSYYRQPDARTIGRMVAQTPDGFMFAVKAHRSLTHEMSGSFQAGSAVFQEGIAPLASSGKLAAVLFQFPHSFHYTSGSRKRLLSIAEAFERYPAAFEFRGRDWYRESVLEEMRRRRITFVNVDEPPLPELLPPTRLVTSDIAYVRLHGRNAGQWWSGDNASRYDYLYSDRELMEWVPGIKTMGKKAGIVVAAFNNHWKGQAVANARRLRELMEEGGEGGIGGEDRMAGR